MKSRLFSFLLSIVPQPVACNFLGFVVDDFVSEILLATIKPELPNEQLSGRSQNRNEVTICLADGGHE